MEEVVTPRPDRAPPWARLGLVVLLLYFFLVGVKALETGIGSFGGQAVEGIFGAVSHPVAGVFAGILATVLVQSSSVTTSMIVGLVGSGVLSVGAAVPMVMGANIGTTVTNTLASLGHVRRGPEFQRALAGATVHDFFNLLSVAVLLPLELLTGVLSSTAGALTELLSGSTRPGVDPGASPVKEAIGAPVGWLEAGAEAVGVSGVVLGVVLLGVGLALIFLALSSITHTMRSLMAGRIEAALNAILGRGRGAGAMLVGIVVTVLVQSSSITTSILIPMVAAGILTLENAYPVTLGANLGTTVTALLASLAAERPEALTIALTHTLFNLVGILLFYPVPVLRRVPLRAARALGVLAAERRRVALGYILGVFVVLPLVMIFVLR